MKSSLKTLDMSLKNFYFEYNSSIDNSVKATIQVLYDVGLFDRFENRDEVFTEFNTCNKRQRGNFKTELL